MLLARKKRHEHRVTKQEVRSLLRELTQRCTDSRCCETVGLLGDAKYFVAHSTVFITKYTKKREKGGELTRKRRACTCAVVANNQRHHHWQ